MHYSNTKDLTSLKVQLYGCFGQVDPEGTAIPGPSRNRYNLFKLCRSLVTERVMPFIDFQIYIKDMPLP